MVHERHEKTRKPRLVTRGLSDQWGKKEPRMARIAGMQGTGGADWRMVIGAIRDSKAKVAAEDTDNSNGSM